MMFFSSIAFVFGACVGSFLNVVILRLPEEESLWRHGSHCTKCQAKIRAYDNIPILSYLLLRGRCRACGARFSSQYFWVELLTGAMFAITFAYRFQTSVPLLLHGEYPAWPTLQADLLPWLGDITLLSVLIAMTWIDARHFIIPLELTVTGLVVGFAVTMLYPAFRGEASRWLAVGAAGQAIIAGGGLFLLVRWLAGLYFKREALGMGDVHLMVMLAMFMNWPQILLVILLSAFLGTIGGIVAKILQRQKNWQFEVPYGPYIGGAAVIAYFWGPQMIRWYLGLFGLQ